MSALLSVQGLGKSFGGVRAADGIDFDIATGELLALIGPNGAGKSTTFNMVNGQLRADRGSIQLEGVELIGKRHGVDVAMLPIGGHYTMDRHDAVAAARLVDAPKVLPIHYGTFPPIETDADAFASDLAADGREAVILESGESLEL